MAVSTYWDPWHEMRRLQHEMTRLFGDIGPGWPGGAPADFPPVNVTRDDTGVVVEALCPGVDRAKLDITVVGDSVTIRGERSPDPDGARASAPRRERTSGAFTRTLRIGERLDPERTHATYTNGVLRIQLARVPEATPKRIAVEG